MAKFKIFYLAGQIQDNAMITKNLEMEVEGESFTRQEAQIRAINECAMMTANGTATQFVALQTVIKIPEFKEITSAVFPNKNNTVEVLVDDNYSGAHLYRISNCTGFDPETKESKYLHTSQEIQFVQKNDDGSVVPGVQTEQLLWMLLDRHKKLNERFPDPNYAEFEKGIQMAIKAQYNRVKERMERGVMGELKK